MDPLFATLDTEAEKLERLMDFVFNVEPEITPEFARGGRLRPFVYCMLATQLRKKAGCK